MIYGDDELKAMVRVLGEAISKVICGERSMELFGVSEDGKPDDAVLIIINGDDWEEVHRRLGDLYDIDGGEYERHSFGIPEDN